MKISIFLDFWNFSLSLRSEVPEFRPDWYRIAPAFLSKASLLLGDKELSLQDFYIFGSYSNSPQDNKLRNWASSFLPKIPGTKAIFLMRQKKSSGPICTKCHSEILSCPKCGGSMLGTEEKCIDTLLATTMLQDAWLGKYETAILASCDKDFIPVIDFLRIKGIQTIHAGIGSRGKDLSNHCWGCFDILYIKDQFNRHLED